MDPKLLEVLLRNFQRNAPAGLGAAIGNDQSPMPPYASMGTDQQDQLMRMLLEAIAANRVERPVGNDVNDALQLLYGSSAGVNPYSDIQRRWGPPTP